MGDRLVIHGMGTQKPYETLDQFACGLVPLLNPLPRPPAHSRALEFPRAPIRPCQTTGTLDPGHRPVPFAPAEHPDKLSLIDLVEYDWAPIINGGSKRFSRSSS